MRSVELDGCVGSSERPRPSCGKLSRTDNSPCAPPRPSPESSNPLNRLDGWTKSWNDADGKLKANTWRLPRSMSCWVSASSISRGSQRQLVRRSESRASIRLCTKTRKLKKPIAALEAGRNALLTARQKPPRSNPEPSRAWAPGRAPRDCVSLSLHGAVDSSINGTFYIQNVPFVRRARHLAVHAGRQKPRPVRGNSEEHDIARELQTAALTHEANLRLVHGSI